MNKFLNTSFVFIFAFALSLNIQAASLPSNIASLVEDSAPAVVNITSRKEVSSQNSYRGMPPELERFFGIPRDYEEAPQQKREAAPASWSAFKRTTCTGPYSLTIRDPGSRHRLQPSPCGSLQLRPPPHHLHAKQTEQGET